VDAQRAYRRFFDVMVRRVISIGFVVVGTLVTLGYLPMLLDPSGSILVNGVAEHRCVKERVPSSHISGRAAQFNR
jgi:hypothetical protein